MVIFMTFYCLYQQLEQSLLANLLYPNSFIGEVDGNTLFVGTF